MNPFEDPDGRFVVVANDDDQHSIWPTFMDVPDGWRVVHDEDSRSRSLAYVDQNWPDIRPRSLRARLVPGRS